ncbi:MAG: shikimate dehydrogenase [Flavobacteriaceae bacterium]|nr:shikimate dehydrogenase [Flavobacteriaceae bacterium]
MTEKNIQENKLFGLLGRNISYSFSSGYFNEKFNDLGLKNHRYINFDIPTINDFSSLPKQKVNGMNVTIPYKEEIIPFLDEIDDEAAEIGAVNTIKFLADGRLRGYNTDVFGFKKSLLPLLESHHTKALILGTGGASKAIKHALDILQIQSTFVSRNPENSNQISYKNLTEAIIIEHTIIVNCTPLGTFPETKLFPDIPYQYINAKHLLYDLIYNPSETTFLKKGKEKGAVVKNGLEMLQLQAEKSWQIWNQ